MALSAGAMGLGLGALKLANQNYEALRDAQGIGVATLVGLGAAGLFLLGMGLLIRVLFRSIWPRAASGHAPASTEARPRRQASAGAKLLWSALGLLMGAIGCSYMFFAAGARLIETETARYFALGALVIFLFLLLIAVVFAILAIFLRGRALARVPACFLLGVVGTWGVFRYFSVNVLEIRSFTDLLH